jgi:hypothetical protein
MRSRRRHTRRKQRGGEAPKVYIFYHIFCNEQTDIVVRQQLCNLIFSGLYKKADAIKCYLTGDPGHIQDIKDLLHKFGKKFVVVKEGPGDTPYERFTLLDIKHHIGPNDKFLYFHSKGVATGNKNAKGKRPDRTNIFWWRTWLEYTLFRRWEECLKLLDTNDVVGAAYSEHHIGPHYSGNFWWAHGSYFLTLPTTIGDGYTDPESYLFKASPRFAHLDQDVLPFKGKNDLNLYDNSIYPTKYVDR